MLRLTDKIKRIAPVMTVFVFGLSIAASAEVPLVGLGKWDPYSVGPQREELKTEILEELILNGKKVAVDPGHQGSWVDMSAQEPIAPGASETKAKATTGTQGAYSGLCEYELNLQVSLCLKEELEKRGYEVVMTREDNDTAISNMERAQLAAAEGADILVRIHANGSDDHSVHGALSMIPSKDNPYVGNLYEECYSLGDNILNSFCEATGFSNIGVQCYDNMSGINWSTIPVTILEMGFMTNESDDTSMADPAFWPVMASGIADGIDDYYGFEHDGVVMVPETEITKKEETEEMEESTETENSTIEDTGKTEVQQIRLGNELEDTLYVYLSENTGKQEHWSVEVLDPETDESIIIHNQQEQAASLIKLYIMGAVYDDYDTLVSEYSKEEIDTLLNRMITVSDNDSANTLTGYLGNGDSKAGMEVVNTFCRENGFTETVMGRLLLAPADHGDNLTSVNDCGEFLRRVYKKEFEKSDDMLALLKQQQRTHKIPSGIPDGIEVANKTGELDRVENDVAIIFTEKPYILCVMSENLENAGAAQSEIGQISYEVFNDLAN